jgi:nucleotide-binding universal stress UspA family protein
MSPIQTILHPTDFSQSAANAFQFACMLARDYAARLVIVHVAQRPMTVLGGTEALPPFADEYGPKELEERLRRLESPFASVRLERRLLTGDPVREILQVAQELPCDLIVMGTHGRTGLSRLLMGSVAEQVVRKAPCPVITVKTPLGSPSLAVAQHPHERVAVSERFEP